MYISGSFDPFRYPVLEVSTGTYSAYDGQDNSGRFFLVNEYMQFERRAQPNVRLDVVECAYCHSQMSIIDRKLPEQCAGCGSRRFIWVNK